MKDLPVVLTVAGSDSSCGAGIQADLKTFSALGCHGLTTVTCVVAEIPGKVASIQPVSPAIVREQLRLLLAAYPVGAVKTGMLFSPSIIRAVAETLAGLKNRPPLVIDPVMAATSGDTLHRHGALSVYRRMLFPMATLITPNLDELRMLTGMTASSPAEMLEAGRRLTAESGTHALLKGGHLAGKSATDILLGPDWEQRTYRAPFVRGVGTHGTGCTYSAAIAAGLARGLPLADAVGLGKKFVTRAIRGFRRWGMIDALDQVQR
jgi:hydroxymethylpyrimidine/phosphomethylpyrimidine kinase